LTKISNKSKTHLQNDRYRQPTLEKLEQSQPKSMEEALAIIRGEPYEPPPPMTEMELLQKTVDRLENMLDDVICRVDDLSDMYQELKDSHDNRILELQQRLEDLEKYLELD
jgi:hypothetical protein